ncbi:MAG: phosphatidylglycerophosphatase A [Bacteroidota bacterium]|nr:phosphatidylglycerophosphatase A [Bacteroidota bacterium]MDP4242594.1 phosphatidylglycerophosphatase A [Bacteroidota bacterium]MDP4289170.1 phosphatidylglycerophosphatase A [Bacteroidota bacterium]
MSGNEQFDWLEKARSRLWARNPKLSTVPKLPLVVGTVFFFGLSPFASGTVGSLVAAGLYFITPPLQHTVFLSIACLLVLIAGTWSAGIVERSLAVQDPGIVVIDEVLGQWVALLAIPPEFNHMTSTVLLAFVFFRIFDVIKLPPARFFERRQGGLGIMLDDVVAGIYANVATRIVLHFLYS